MSHVGRSGFERTKSRIERLLERLHRTSFRDRTERELLVTELGRTLAALPSTAERSTGAPADELAGDSREAVAAVERAFRALEAPEAPDAWASRLARLQSGIERLLADEEDLLAAHPSEAAVATG
jgi:hypothetical protein